MLVRAESGKRVVIAGTKVPVPKQNGTHPLGWAESGMKVVIAGTKVPVPRCFGTRTLVRALCL